MSEDNGIGFEEKIETSVCELFGVISEDTIEGYSMHSRSCKESMK